MNDQLFVLPHCAEQEGALNYVSDMVLLERTRCANLVQALLDSVPVPTSLSLVITAEKMFLPGAVDEEIAAEQRRCIQIVDAAAVRELSSKPAEWALSAIRTGVDVIPSREPGG